MSQAALNARERATKADSQSQSQGRRSNGGQLAGMFFLLLVLATIGWSAWAVLSWMDDAKRLPLSELVVTGDRHYTTNDDIRQSILSLGEPGTFMTQDVNIIQQQIERLPWIKQVSVRKQWPNELKIHLVEYVPVAHWNDLHMVDVDGKSFSIPAERIAKQKMPLLYGPEGSEQDVLQGYQTMSQQLASASSVGKFAVKSVSMTARHSWQITLDDDIRIDLGRDDRNGRLQRFIELYPRLQQQADADKKRISYVDLRYESGAAVGWAPAFIDPAGSDGQKDGQQNNRNQNQAQAKQQ